MCIKGNSFRAKKLLSKLSIRRRWTCKSRGQGGLLSFLACDLYFLISHVPQRQSTKQTLFPFSNSPTMRYNEKTEAKVEACESNVSFFRFKTHQLSKSFNNWKQFSARQTRDNFKIRKCLKFGQKKGHDWTIFSFSVFQILLYKVKKIMSR